jgi:hypothetical protein
MGSLPKLLVGARSRWQAGSAGPSELVGENFAGYFRSVGRMPSSGETGLLIAGYPPSVSSTLLLSARLRLSSTFRPKDRRDRAKHLPGARNRRAALASSGRGSVRSFVGLHDRSSIHSRGLAAAGRQDSPHADAGGRG